MTATDIEIAVANMFDVRKCLVVPNVSWGLIDHEADLLVMRPSGYCLEVEIKVSMADFKKDFDKPHKHGYWNVYSNEPRKPRLLRELWYAMPAKMHNQTVDAMLEDLVPHAGLITVNGKEASRVKMATPNTEALKLNTKQRFQLARLGSLRVWSLKQKLQKKWDESDPKRMSGDRIPPSVDDLSFG